MNIPSNVVASLDDVVKLLNAPESFKQNLEAAYKDSERSVNSILHTRIGMGDSLFLESCREYQAHSTFMASQPPPPPASMDFNAAQDSYEAGMIALVIGQNNLDSNTQVQNQLDAIQQRQTESGDAKIQQSDAKAASSEEKSGVMKVISWATSIAEEVVGAALCATGVGAGVGAELMVSGTIGILSNIAGSAVTKAVADVLEDFGVPKKYATIIATVIVVAATLVASFKLPSSLGASLAGRLTSTLADASAESAGEIMDSVAISAKSLDKVAAGSAKALAAIQDLNKGADAAADVTDAENAINDLNTAVGAAKQSATRLQDAIGELKTAISEGASAKTVATKSEQVLELAQEYKTSVQAVTKAADTVAGRVSQSSDEIAEVVAESISNASESSKLALKGAEDSAKLAQTFNDTAAAEAYPTSLAGRVRAWARSQLPEDTIGVKRTLVNITRARLAAQGILGAGQIDAAVSSGMAGFAEAKVMEFQGSFTEEATIIQQNIQSAKNFLQDIQATMSQAGQAIANSRTQGIQA